MKQPMFRHVDETSLKCSADETSAFMPPPLCFSFFSPLEDCLKTIAFDSHKLAFLAIIKVRCHNSYGDIDREKSVFVIRFWRQHYIDVKL